MSTPVTGPRSTASPRRLRSLDEVLVRRSPRRRSTIGGQRRLDRPRRAPTSCRRSRRRCRRGGAGTRRDADLERRAERPRADDDRLRERRRLRPRGADVEQSASTEDADASRAKRVRSDHRSLGRRRRGGADGAVSGGPRRSGQGAGRRAGWARICAGPRPPVGRDPSRGLGARFDRSCTPCASKGPRRGSSGAASPPGCGARRCCSSSRRCSRSSRRSSCSSGERRAHGGPRLDDARLAGDRDCRVPHRAAPPPSARRRDSIRQARRGDQHEGGESASTASASSPRSSTRVIAPSTSTSPEATCSASASPRSTTPAASSAPRASTPPATRCGSRSARARSSIAPSQPHFPARAPADLPPRPRRAHAPLGRRGRALGVRDDAPRPRPRAVQRHRVVIGADGVTVRGYLRERFIAYDRLVGLDAPTPRVPGVGVLGLRLVDGTTLTLSTRDLGRRARRAIPDALRRGRACVAPGRRRHRRREPARAARAPGRGVARFATPSPRKYRGIP